MIQTKILSACLLLLSTNLFASTLFDIKRQRAIPYIVTTPSENVLCTPVKPCPVAIISAGYGIAHGEYTFISQQLTKMGFLSISVGHELPNDPPLSVTGNLFETRAENWQRGADTIRFLRLQFQKHYPAFDFENLTLIGHSNGGDISAWLVNSGASFVSQLITLDHRRVPLTRDKNLRVLSIRASDYPADEGVLPSAKEQSHYNICITTIAKARHNDIHDGGPKWLQQSIEQVLTRFITDQSCSTAK